MSHPTELLNLAVELQPIIIEALCKDDILNFRLTCRFVNKLCTPFVFTRIVEEMKGPEFKGLYLHKAATTCSHELISVLLEYQPPLNCRNKAGETALHVASQKGCIDCVESLAHAGADLSVVSRRGWTPLMLAARHGNSTVAGALLRLGADPNIRGFHGWTALHLAQQFDRRDIVGLLKEAGADGSIADNGGSKAGEV
ncbi:Ankyrin repeat and protein kinase domain-containing protein 1 [Cladobotryum mycophilum]|uniref:Ankyrin repeat and protein kinase domain-containing protein 1 n=1 Tax=Cladobotryum mycophilum TaxID=491253 RepID=A0ABR0SVZ3_9HYPO